VTGDETRIRIAREDHHFAAAHFLVEMGKCERLHGHNYQVSVELGGRPGPDETIIDFNTVNPIVKRLCDEIDHRILLAERDPRQTLTVTGEEIEIRFGVKRYVFPKAECVVVPVEATTVERLAAWLAGRLADLLADRLPHVDWIEVGVREGGAQTALYRRPLRKRE
jgi:6-pyruvoyltetrahydropterin/6-carboxytetrahydropterin synthase